MEKYFEKFRENIIGYNQTFETPYGTQKMIYADWVASGRQYGPIEKKMAEVFAPFVGNTHTETSITGTLMTRAYLLAHKKIKEHVNASESDVIITAGFGMTALINKFQRMLGFKTYGDILHYESLPENDRPVIFITHIEHHSNQISWYETIADVVLLKPDKDLLVDLDELRRQLKKYENRKIKVGAFSACSNVTGIETPYYEMAKIMHENGGLCFIDFAASAPYVKIDMHPEDPMKKLDAVFFSPHKFLGGPGASGVLVFDSALYRENEVPDQPGGGTVDWTNRWGEYKYTDNIELREDGGTPGFLQAIRTALCIELKNQMGVDNIRKREAQLVKIALEKLSEIKGLHILSDNVKKRLGIISFCIENVHYNLVVKILNDRFGIQVRGGCVCAGTYGHYLLGISHKQSKEMTDRINLGDFSEKAGFVRISLHPTMTDEELNFIIDAVKQISENYQTWQKDYVYNKHTNIFTNIKDTEDLNKKVAKWFKL